jgi:hypothetical protein
MTEEEAGHVICLHTHEHTSITRILAQARFLKGRAVADFCTVGGRLRTPKEPLSSGPSRAIGCAKGRAVYSPHLPVRGNVRQPKKVACYEKKYQDQC